MPESPSPTELVDFIGPRSARGREGIALMRRWIVLALVGLAAQLVDGSLGMAYGVTSTTLLLAAGTAPAMASASVHLAEVGTTLASGASHWRLGNVDWSVVRRIALPGAIGAFLGATVLSHLSTEWAAPWMSALLLGARRLRPGAVHLRQHRPPRRAGPLALPGPRRPRRRLHRRQRRRRLGPGGHARAAEQRQDGAPHGDRHRRHVRVRGVGRRQPGLLPRPRLGGARPAGRHGAARRRRRRGARSPPGWCAWCRRACSVPPWAG